MALKQYNPTSPGRRFMTTLDFDELTKKQPERALTEPLRRSGGRNNKGRITIWFRGGGHKRRYRVIDFRRDKRNVPAKVAAIEYDPEPLGAHRAPALRGRREALHPGARGAEDRADRGGGRGGGHPARQRAAAQDDPAGTMIHNLELRLGKGGQLVRSRRRPRRSWWRRRASTRRCELPSGEMRKVHVDCVATIGQVGNIDHKNVSFGKAGRKRWLGKKPHNRGVAMNPVDHPHGGGEGTHLRRASPGDPVGQADQGRQDPQQQADRSASSSKRRK